jgi:hemoglobin
VTYSGPCQSSAAHSAAEGSEEQIAELVRLFYARVHQDDVIGPVFNRFVRDWDQHLQVMRDFWSSALLGSGRYSGNGFSAHMRLPLEEAHFDRWLALWERTAGEALPPALAERAIKRGRHMAQSYRVGLLPWKRPDGSGSRQPG